LAKYTATCRLTNLFVDPTGNHLLLTFAPKSLEGGPELLYLSRKSNKLKSTTKFRGHEFTEVAWNHLNDSESTTGPILLGTSKGLIFETEIVLEGDKFFTSGFSSSLEQYWRQVSRFRGASFKFKELSQAAKLFAFVREQRSRRIGKRNR
jgi:hypothetical protein